MNIYFLDPQWMRRERLDVFIKILKVKKVFCFIHKDVFNAKDIMPSTVDILQLNSKNMQSFLRDCVYSFVKEISVPIKSHGEFEGEYYVRDIYSESMPLNPIYNIENLDDPNILILRNLNSLGTIGKDFRTYSMNILNKYGNIDYMSRICFYYFDKYLYCSYILDRVYDYTGINYQVRFAVLSRTVEESWKSNNDTNWNWVREKQVFYDPLLSYLFFKSNDVYKEDSIQKRFLTTEGIICFEKEIINNYRDIQNDSYSYDDNDNNMNDWGQDSEMDYILNNGGDWIYD